MSDPDIPTWLLELTSRNPEPGSFSEPVVRMRYGDPADINLDVGQVWRAGWADVAVLLLIAEVSEGEVRASPVTIDPPAEDQNSFVVAPDLTGFPTPVTVWTGLTRSVPQRTLDTLLATWPKDITTYLADSGTLVGGRQLPDGIRRGRPIESEFDDRSSIRADLEDDVDQLVQMPGLPVESPESPSTTLAAVLGDFDLAALCTALELSQAAVMKILRGTTALTLDQATVVARITGVPRERVTTAVRRIPHGLALAAEHPRWRHTWTERAQRLGTDETQARLDGCQQVLALVARQTGGSHPDWDARLRRVLFGEEGLPR